MKVGIAGTGGIGSNVALYLVRSGVQCLKIVDFDRVDASNLNRQFFFADQIGRFKVDALMENLLRIAPKITIEKEVLKLDASNMAATFKLCDVIVEGFDGSKDKKILLETLSSPDRWIVSASGVAGAGLNTIEIRQIGDNTIIGDFKTDAGNTPCYAPKVSAVAAMMADAILTKGGFYG